MAIKVQASFSAGELDPALHERTTLQKYSTGLATARNCVVGKTGRLLSRPGRKHVKAAKPLNKKVKIYAPPGRSWYLEIGHQYARLDGFFDRDGSMFEWDVNYQPIPESGLDAVNFISTNGLIYVFSLYALQIYTFGSDQSVQVSLSTYFAPTTPISSVYASVRQGTGHEVEYAVTCMINGLESVPIISTGVGAKIPILASERNELSINYPNNANATEFRVYRRPLAAGSFGYIGSTTFQGSSFNNSIFTDVGQAADYAHSPPTSVLNFNAADTTWMKPKTGIIYQQRLLIVDPTNDEVIHASRVGYFNSFTRDYPISNASALTFKAGASGGAKILRMIDSDGLVVFTSRGIYRHQGALTPTNLTLEKKGEWVLDETVPPLGVPGGVLFVDSATNTVRVLAWSNEAGGYSGEEQSVFSDHLFTGRKIKSWGFHYGDIPMLFVTFSDGNFASFTYERDQQMRAWTRHDTPSIKLEQVCQTGLPDQTLFVVNKAGVRTFDMTNPRYVQATVAESDSESYMSNVIAAMDSIKTFSTKVNNSIYPNVAVFTFVNLNNDWSLQLKLTSDRDALDNPYAGLVVGDVLRVFEADGAPVDLTVDQISTSPRFALVTPSRALPSSLVTGANVYKTQTTFTGLTHLEGEKVSIVSDGYVIASPNNDYENYPTVTVTGGSVTLPSGIRGAIVHIGRPFTADIETLDIDTVEQRPVLLESKSVNKVYIKTHRTRGLYAGGSFPKNDKVNGMSDLDLININYEDDIEIHGGQFQKPTSERIEVTLEGDWDSNGRICLRQVDPLHFEVLSIIPDLDDQRR